MVTVQSRQGDVLLVKSDVNYEGEIVARARIVLEVGEASGHEHVLIGDVQLIVLDKPRLVPGYSGVVSTQMVVVNGQARFAHLAGNAPTTEHDEILIDKGVYFRLPQYQYTPRAVRQVFD